MTTLRSSSLLSPTEHNTLAAVLGAPVTEARVVERGYTQARRLVVRASNGERAFVKLATDEETAGWLRAEQRFYQRMDEEPWLARVRASVDEGGVVLLALEDLSDADWSASWSAARIDAVRATLAQLADSAASWLPTSSEDPNTLPGWASVLARPEEFLSLGLVSPVWLDAHGATLAEAAARAPTHGDIPAHGDVRSDNICTTPERGTILVDWNWASLSGPGMDLAYWAPSLSAEGGPKPWVLLPDAPEWAAHVSGYFAANAGRPGPTEQLRRIRALQLRQLREALPWAIRALGLPPSV